MCQPSIETARLIMRPFRLGDAPAVQLLARERDIADMTMNMLHPYEDGMAEEWILGHESAFLSSKSVAFAIVLGDDDRLVGAIGLRVDRGSNNGELGYWVGKPYWNRGYATEAVKALLSFGFRELVLDRVHALHLARNPASGRVMQKAGIRCEGKIRQPARERGRDEDLLSYNLSRKDWLQAELAT